MAVITPLNDCEKEGTLYFIPFSSTLKLTEVILGPLCSLSLQKVRRIVKHNYLAVTTFKARLASKSFRIIPSGKTVPTISA